MIPGQFIYCELAKADLVILKTGCHMMASLLSFQDRSPAEVLCSSQSELSFSALEQVKCIIKQIKCIIKIDQVVDVLSTALADINATLSSAIFTGPKPLGLL